MVRSRFGALIGSAAVVVLSAPPTYAQAEETAVPVPAPAEPSSSGILLADGSFVDGRVVEERPGAYVIVERPDGTRLAVDWALIEAIDGKTPPPLPPPGNGSLIPEGFVPSHIAKLSAAGQTFSESAKGLVSPSDGDSLIGSIQGTQDALESLGLKRGPPNVFGISYAMFMMPLCFEGTYGTVARVDGTGMLGGLCRYVILPISVGLLVASPFMDFIGGSEVKEMRGPSVHHVDLSIYALDYSKKSALTGSYAREPEGGFLGNNLGYDFGYTYIHPENGFIGYSHLTLQQTSLSSTEYLQVSSSFFKADAQVGLDVIRLITGGSAQSYWSRHTAFFRAGPSLFHNWILSRDVEPGAGAAVDNPLNNSVPLVTGLGYEIAAELDFRFPFWLGGVHFKFERGSYPALSFPGLDPRDAALVALIGFDDLRAGDTYTWQRLKLEVELPIDYSRAGGISLGGQLVRYENNFGSGVDNRGLSLDYRLRFQ